VKLGKISEDDSIREDKGGTQGHNKEIGKKSGI